jgi:xylulokinase
MQLKQLNTVLGIDLGTQALKVVFYDFERRYVAAAESAALDLHQGSGGVVEQQAHWWLKALHDALTKVDPDIRQSVLAVAVSGQQHGFVAVDEADKVVAPVKLWCDTSTVSECAEIMDAFGGRSACIEETGNPVLPGYTASKIRWLKKARPQAYREMDCILLPHDYLNLYLTGERCMEMGDASGTGFLDVWHRCWSHKMLKAIDAERDLNDCLPPLRSANQSIGSLRPEVADDLGLPGGIPVGIGGGDNMMGAIGTANVRPGNMTMSLGTSGTLYAYADQPCVDPKGNIAAFCSSTGGWLPLLCTMNCTVSTELIRGLLGADISDFEAMISSAPPGAGGVTTLPFFNGERTPNLPNSKGCIIGLSSDNTNPGNLLRSAVEGATFALKFGIDELTRLGVNATEIVLTGGGARSDKWRQLVADICAAPVTVYKQDEGAAFGAALQALQLIEESASIGELVDTHMVRDEMRCCEPRSNAVSNYQELFDQYQRAVAVISTLYA